MCVCVCVVFISSSYPNHLYLFWLILDLDVVTFKNKGTGEDVLDDSHPTALHFTTSRAESWYGPPF